MECIAQRKMENSLKAIKAEIATSNVDVVLSDFYLMSREKFQMLLSSFNDMFWPYLRIRRARNIYDY